jgi:hypothetical protein
MKSKEVDISMCWDGETRRAELTVDGMTLVGEPDDVQGIFTRLNLLRERARFTDTKRERIQLALSAAEAELHR